MELPEIQEIRRWRIVHGDRLIVRLARLHSQQQAADIESLIRRRLALPDDCPVLITDESVISVEVAES